MSRGSREAWSDVERVLDIRLLDRSGVDVTLGGVLLAVLAIAGVALLSHLIQRALDRYATQHPEVNRAALYTASRLIRYVVLALGILLTMDAAGIPIGRFTVFAGAIGVGLGFGLQAIFNNFLAGLILLFDRSLKIDDFVELDGGIRGTVRAINIRFTRITTNDHLDILVPNSEFITKRVVNWTYGSVNRRLRVPFGVAYGTDKELVKKAALEAASRVPFTLAMEGEHAPRVWLVGFGDSSVDFLLVVWLNAQAARRYTSILSAYLWELDTSLKEHGIEIPFPQRDVHVRSAVTLNDATQLAEFATQPSIYSQKTPSADDATTK